jgi:ferredoxin
MRDLARAHHTEAPREGGLSMPRGETVSVDPIRCTGHGMCAELLPERIVLDDWGYPIVDPTDVPPGLREHARRAVKACPVLALKFDRGTR